jgi:hypothetical protein
VGPDDAEVDQELRDGLAGHRGAPVGVDHPGSGSDAGDGGSDERLGELGGLTRGNQPPGCIPAVDVQDHVQVVELVPAGAGELGDIP